MAGSRKRQLRRIKNRKRNKESRKIGNSVKKDLAKASNIAQNTLDLSPLSRVDASRSPEITNLLAQHQSLSDPFSQAYVGQRSGQLKDYVARLQDLTQGYDSNEMTALRDQRRREMERGFQTGRASLARGQNVYRLGATQRAAQLAGLAKDYGRSSADAENDLFVRGADEKRRAITQYGDTIRGYEADEFNRSQQALKNYSDLLNESRANELEREKINLGQEAADRAAQAGGQLGVMQIMEARRKARQQNRLIRQGYKSNERIASGSSGGSGGGGTSGPSYAEELAALAESYRQ